MPHFIWTYHATQRLRDRKIPKSSIDTTLSHPEKTIHKPDGTQELQKKIDGRLFAAIIKPNDKGEKIILSLWANPPFPGTRDARQRARYFEMQKASFGRKLWLTLLNQLGL